MGVGVDCQQVGKNIHEHHNVPNARLVDALTYSVRKLFSDRLAAADFALRQRGMLTTCAVHAHAHTSPNLAPPISRCG